MLLVDLMVVMMVVWSDEKMVDLMDKLWAGWRGFETVDSMAGPQAEKKDQNLVGKLVLLKVGLMGRQKVGSWVWMRDEGKDVLKVCLMAVRLVGMKDSSRVA